MYTQIPAELYQKHVGMIPGTKLFPVTGFAPQHQNMMTMTQTQQRLIQQGTIPQQAFMPPELNQHGTLIQTFNPQQNHQQGNYVYTRRIIDPNSNSVVAE